MALQIKILVFCILKKTPHLVDFEYIDIHGYFYEHSVGSSGHKRIIYIMSQRNTILIV